MSWAPDYAERQFLKDYLNIDDTADDLFIDLWITTASRNVDDFCGRQFGKVATAEARTYTPVWHRHRCAYVVEVDDLQDLTGLDVVDADGATMTGYTFEPVNALLKGRPYERLIFGSAATTPSGDVTPTAPWGWTAAPSAVTVGMLLQAARLNVRRRSPFGVAGSPSEGSEVRLLAQLDPDFRTSLKPLVRDWWAR